MSEDKFQVGQKVIRYMGASGGFWGGEITERKGNEVRVAFDNFMTLPFEIDEHLFAAPTTDEEARVLAEHVRQVTEKNAALNAELNKPQWPKGYFGEEPSR